ncbi:MAG: Fur family transcriptional regulator [Chthoniobacterales bacterium]
MENSESHIEYPEREHVLEHLRAYLQERGMRRTAQRDAIIKAAFSTKEHFSAEALLDMAKRIDISVSRATVYRTLPLLVESGLLRELDLGGETKVYDPNFIEHPTHNHLICMDCEKIVEFEDTNMELLENCITRRLGFSPINKSIKIEAHCDEFARLGHCNKRNDS